MPIYQLKNISELGKIGIWNITENTDRLLHLLSNKGFDTTTIPKKKNDLHLKQWLAVRLLCYEFLNDFEINYAKNGKPLLTNGLGFSVSHSGNYAAIIINDTPCGIDIEKVSEKVDRIKHKFLNKAELDDIHSSDHPLRMLTIYWSAKEALYKLYGKKELIFQDQLLISPLKDADLFNGTIQTKKMKHSYTLKVEFFEEYVLVYTI